MMRCRVCDDSSADCTLCATRAKALRECRGASEQPAASTFQIRERFASANTAREIQQWKAITLIADLANATLRTYVDPNELQETLRTIRRTAQLATSHVAGRPPRPRRRGPQTHIVEADVAEMRRAYAAMQTLATIAQRYKMTREAVRSAITGASWRHVTAPPPVPMRRRGKL